MRTFSEVRQQLGLKKFLTSPLGTLYFIPFAPGAPRVIVRHFDSELPAALVKPYAELVGAVHRSVERRPELDRVIRIEQPLEVGLDFVARPHHSYYTSIDAYEEWEDPPEPPAELDQMRHALQAAIAQPADEKEEIVGRVLARSLLEATGKTFFDESQGRFIVVEPKLTREDVERWAALSGQTPTPPGNRQQPGGRSPQLPP